MKTLLAAALLAPVALATAGIAQAADARRPHQEPDDYGGVRIGTLSCEVGGGIGYVLGSAKTVNCVFTSTAGRTEYYAGSIRKLGVDLGFTTRQGLVWAVFAPTAGYHRGSLSGFYGGATVEATIGAGVGGNLLVGGTTGSIHLQMLSVTGQIGLNVAATGTSMTLNPVN
ncbi:DUF992 domain-containing protein [Arvimicrobium flavum]|uniref:DUF992 domain-containing protein n=1 Tax=Arvimicrobium flavum TaxID=3393320 RepID=UPI00237C51E5|nr:DUF992 domain-containing protein [Mesorhizobium shangrilense]